MTLWELSVRAGGAFDREHRAQQRQIWSSWHTAAWGRTKTMPKLKDLLKPKKAAAPQPQVDEVGVAAALDRLIKKNKEVKASAKDR